MATGTTKAQGAALLKMADVAKLASMSTRTIWRLIAVGRFPEPIRWNRKLVRWSALAVGAWLAGLGAALPQEAQA